jgi:hypothetical protein
MTFSPLSLPMGVLMPRDLESVIAEVMRATVYKTRPSEDEHELRTSAVAAAVREYLLSDEAVARTSRAFEPETWDDASWPQPEFRDAYRADALVLARAALAAALGVERGE